MSNWQWDYTGAFGAPEGYYPPNPQATHPPAPYFPNGPVLLDQQTSILPNGSDHDTRNVFDDNRNTIPGLGFSQPTDRQRPWLNPSAVANAEASSLSVLLGRNSAGSVDVGKNGITAASEESMRQDAMEEGELSEGELEEDIYEPKGIDDQAQSAESQNSQDSGVSTCDAAATQEQGMNIDDRSGSYSPYLSPREINMAPSGSHPELPQG